MKLDGFKGLRARHPFASQVGMLTVGRAGAALFSALWMIAAARLLPREVFGDLALLLAVGAVGSVIADGGYSTALNHLVARMGRTSWLPVRQVLRTRLLAALVTAFITAVAYLAVADSKDPLVPAVFTLSLLATTVHSTVTAALRGAGEVGFEAWNELLSRLGVLVIATLWISSGGGLLAAVTVYAIADLVSAGIMIFLFHRRCLPEPQTSLQPSLSPRAVAPLAAAGLLGVLIARLDLWVLALLGSASAVADYAAASRLLEAVLLPAGAIAAMVLARTALLSFGERLVVLRRLVTWAAGVTLPCAALLALAGSSVVRVVFGQAFSEAANVLPILMLSTGPAVVVLVIGPVLATSDRRRFLACIAACLAVKLAMNLSLIPAFGIAGAAWAAVFAQISLAVLLRRYLLRRPEIDLSSKVMNREAVQLA